MQLTRLLLCKGSNSNVDTCFVRLAIPFPAIPEPVKTPVVVITAAPPALPRNAEVPLIPIVPSAAPNPAPMTGAKRPAESPMTKPPPESAVNQKTCPRVSEGHAPNVANPTII